MHKNYSHIANIFSGEKIKTIAWITLVWTLLSFARFFFVFTLVRELDCNIEHINIWVQLQGTLLTGILAGVLGGSGIVFLWERWLRSMTYKGAVFGIIMTYGIIYLLVDIPVNLYTSSYDLQLGILDSSLWQYVLADLFSLSTLESFLFWLFVVLATLIVLLVSDKYGPGIFWSFLMGKYFHPRREERVFMFLDLRSSTQIAETLGEEKYFNFIKEVFKTITPSILSAKGEIYQYVGDEVVISWPMDRKNHYKMCLDCFYNIKKSLNDQNDHFLSSYGLVPNFKAGLHFGHVMAGEIGIVKRDIAYSGDVLNTTARIQSKCNELGVDILMSKRLVDRLAGPDFSFGIRHIGDIELRGKVKDVSLFTVDI